MEIIVASNNKGKIIEYKRMLAPLGFEVFSQGEKNIDIDVEETGSTFEENASIKAHAIYDLTHTSVIADDSGLCVDYLNGEPGIYSARYKGLKTESERRKSILEELDGIENRKATFYCCICYIDSFGKESTVVGEYKGSISKEERGSEGFGYDSIFIPDGEVKTNAELGVDHKNKYGHRAKATLKLLELLK